MRLLAYVVVTALCVFSTSSSSAQQTPAGSEPSSGVSAPNAVVNAPVVPAPNTVQPAPGPAEPVSSAVTADPKAGLSNSVVPAATARTPGALPTDAKVERANAWVAFEQ